MGSSNEEQSQQECGDDLVCVHSSKPDFQPTSSKRIVQLILYTLLVLHQLVFMQYRGDKTNINTPS